MGIKKYVCGNEMEMMPDVVFRVLTLVYRVGDVFYRPERRVGLLGIKRGATVVDYGCGPGRYVKAVCGLVGETGKVYAVDIHHLALASVKSLAGKRGLKNVEPILADGYSCGIGDHVADVTLVLDTFHMIRDPGGFLREVHRITKNDGCLIVDDGHQPRVETKAKLLGSGLWDISEERRDHLRCTPVSQVDLNVPDG